ncbi:MAG: ribbon-helix-helix domain-containing protein [Defluviitaleaceae bacterium]|nr:ribbon-helix-helix domain-containing protein [Defluviitaleaceae bacterium]
MDKKFIVTPKSEKTVTMTIRLDREYNAILEKLSLMSGRSRNELINMSVKFALDNMEFAENK